MHINTNSWHYKWYKWTYTVWNDIPYNHTNLCRYTQRIFWMTLLTGIAYTFFLFLCIIYYLIATPIAFIFGGRPRNLFTNSPTGSDPELFISYDGLFGWLKPWHVSSFMLLAYLEYVGWRTHSFGMTIGHVIGGVVVLIGLGLLWLYSNSETSRLARAWIDSKKKHVCPVIEFTEEPTSNNIDE